MKELEVEQVIISKQKENSEHFQEFLKIAKQRKINVVIVKAGDRIMVENKLYIDILWPTADFEISENALNNNSIVAKLSYKNFSMLCTGDIEEIAEKTILKRYSNNLNKLRANILKVAHHGSKTSSSKNFLEAVKPKYALIGVGENNKFGHPNEQVLDRFTNLRCEDL